jgi:hypothetical protein
MRFSGNGQILLVSNGGWSCPQVGNGQLVCTRSSLSPGQVTGSVFVAAQGSNVTIEVSSDTPDPNPGNNRRTV